MGWKAVGGNFPESIFFKEVGDEVIGKYIETKQIHTKDDKDRTIYILEVAGVEKTLWGSGLLDYLMKDVKAGQTIRVVYNGKETVEIKGKKRKCNQFSVEIETEE